MKKNRKNLRLIKNLKLKNKRLQPSARIMSIFPNLMMRKGKISSLKKLNRFWPRPRQIMRNRKISRCSEQMNRSWLRLLLIFPAQSIIYAKIACNWNSDRNFKTTGFTRIISPVPVWCFPMTWLTGGCIYAKCFRKMSVLFRLNQPTSSF